jgi:hypothetical protein
MKTITVEEELPVSIAPLTNAGKPAKIDGDPIWALSEGAPGTLEPGATPFEKVFRPFPDGQTGAALITVEVDADLGEGVRMLNGALAVAVVAAEAATLAINAGEATPITPAPAADPVSTDAPPATDADAVTEEATTEAAGEEAQADAPAADPVAEAQPEVPTGEIVTETPAEGGEKPAE